MSLPSYKNFKTQTIRSLNPVRNIRNLTHGDVQGALGEAQGGLAPAPPPPAPGVPQIDEAASRIAESDRLKRRRGALANIYAGNAARPAVGKPTLGG